MELFESNSTYKMDIGSLEVGENELIFRRGKRCTHFFYTGLNNNHEYVFKPEDFENKCCGMLVFKTPHPFTLICYKLGGILFCDLVDIQGGSITYRLDKTEK